MSFFDWVKGGGVAEFADSSSITEQIFDAIVQAQTASGIGGLGVAAIFRARQIIADTISSLPLKAGDSLVPAPNGDQDWQSFLSETVLSLQDTGDAYWHVGSDGLRVLDAGEMVVRWSEWNGFTRRRIYEFRLREMRTAGVSKNLHVVSVNRSSHSETGLGWLESGRIRGIIAVDQYSQEYFENNAMPAGIMSTPKEPTQDEAALIKKQVLESQKSRSLMIKPTTWDFEASSFSPNDSQWVDSHLTSIGDVSNLSGVPAFLLSYTPPGSTQEYENVEALLIRLWRETLQPTYAARLESSLSELLGMVVKFDAAGMFLTSLVNRADSASKLVGAGYDAGDVAGTVGFPDMGFERTVVSDVVS